MLPETLTISISLGSLSLIYVTEDPPFRSRGLQDDLCRIDEFTGKLGIVKSEKHDITRFQGSTWGAREGGGIVLMVFSKEGRSLTAQKANSADQGMSYRSD